MADSSNSTTTATGGSGAPPFPLPRVTIKFCTQCKWMLRAAYYAQELLSTFSTSLGEVALQPSTGGTFVVEIFHPPTTTPSTTTSTTSTTSTILWDRKTDGGFPETKELKRRVRDVIEPGRNLGHVDRDHHAKPTTATPSATPSATPATDDSTAEEKPKEVTGGGGQGKEDCEDCK